jgi:hypothetical protein
LIAKYALLRQGPEPLAGSGPRVARQLVEAIDPELGPIRQQAGDEQTFQVAVPMFQSVAGLLTKYFYVSEDGRRAGGVYVWASRADADRLYNGEWRAFVEKKFGSPPTIDFLDSPVMVDNRDRKSAEANRYATG